MSGYSLTNFLLCQLGEIPELPRAVIAELFLHLQCVLALPAADEPATTAGCAEADPLGFEQHNIESLFGQI